MAKPVKRGDGQMARMRQPWVDLDMFWKEFESIEPRVEDDEEEDNVNGNLIKDVH